MEIQAATLDIDPAAPIARPGRVPGVGEDAPGTLQLLAGAAAWQAGLPLRLVRTAGHLAQTTGRLADAARRGELAGLTLPFTAPRTSLNGPVSTRRDYAFCSVSLAAAKQAARHEQVTVNDVVLALTGGALRRYLQDRGELPGRSLTTVVPLGLPADPSQPASGNRWAVMLASLATDVPDPVQRLHKIAASARAGKAAQRAIGPDTWMDITDLPPLMVAALARGYGGLRLANLHPAVSNVVVSNVRSASFPLYLAGARMLASYPMAPIVDGGGLNVTVVSYLDSLDFGLLTCPDLVENPWQLVDALRAEEAELAARYVKRPARRRRPATASGTPARARGSSSKKLQKALSRTDGGASPGYRSRPASAPGTPSPRRCRSYARSSSGSTPDTRKPSGQLSGIADLRDPCAAGACR
jgi:WS/DGAT/MGAT family acyltransferase